MSGLLDLPRRFESSKSAPTLPAGGGYPPAGRSRLFDRLTARHVRDVEAQSLARGEPFDQPSKLIRTDIVEVEASVRAVGNPATDAGAVMLTRSSEARAQLAEKRARAVGEWLTRRPKVPQHGYAILGGGVD